MRELIINRGNERYIFRYNAGQEEEILTIIADQARNKDLSLDCFDAAILSRAVEKSLTTNF